MSWGQPAAAATDQQWGATAPAKNDSQWGASTPAKDDTQWGAVTPAKEDSQWNANPAKNEGQQSSPPAAEPQQEWDGAAAFSQQPDQDDPPRERERERESRPLIDWSHHPEMDSEEAWRLFQAADAEKDMDDIKDAFEVYARNTPTATFQSIEERMRAEKLNTHLICLEKQIPMNKTNVDLQMNPDRQYVVGFQLTKKSRRTKMNEGMIAETYEANFERLADCGFTVTSRVPVCYNCNQKGHIGKNCPEGVPDPEERDMSHVVKVVCSNCEQEGHRLRNCPEPRKVRSKGCRNCGSEEHMVADCDQPKKPREGESCHNCGSADHYGKDCTEPRKPREDTRECYNCQKSGHIGRDCPEPRKSRAEREAMMEARNDTEAYDADSHKNVTITEESNYNTQTETPQWGATGEQPTWGGGDVTAGQGWGAKTSQPAAVTAGSGW